jgi:hypothetical protein
MHSLETKFGANRSCKGSKNRTDLRANMPYKGSSSKNETKKNKFIFVTFSWGLFREKTKVFLQKIFVFSLCGFLKNDTLFISRS